MPGDGADALFWKSLAEKRDSRKGSLRARYPPLESAGIDHCVVVWRSAPRAPWWGIEVGQWRVYAIALLASRATRGYLCVCRAVVFHAGPAPPLSSAYDAPHAARARNPGNAAHALAVLDRCTNSAHTPTRTCRSRNAAGDVCQTVLRSARAWRHGSHSKSIEEVTGDDARNFSARASCVRVRLAR